MAITNHESAYAPTRPYNDLPLLPPVSELESKAILKAAIEANRVLAELKGVGEHLPDPNILIDAVALQEARVSSEIEGIVTTSDQLYRALSDATGAAADPQAKEVLRYRQALWHGFNRIKAGRPLCTGLYEELVQLIKQNQAGIRKTPGTQLKDMTNGRVVYTPPEGESILRDKLANLDTYIHETDSGLDPLIKLAVIHYQFEAIHPFSDGNGRTGRIVNILYLVERGLLDLPVLYLSRRIIERKTDYYALLREVTEGAAWEPWVLFMLDAVQDTAARTIQQIRSIRALMDDYRGRVQKDVPKVYSHELIDVLFERPYCKIGFLVDRKIAHRQTAATYLKAMTGAGLLESLKIGREVYYINTEFLKLLKQEDLSSSAEGV